MGIGISFSNGKCILRLARIRQKSTDLSVYSQELDNIADSLNTRSRKTLDWRTPLGVYAEELKKPVAGPSTLQ